MVRSTEVVRRIPTELKGTLAMDLEVATKHVRRYRGQHALGFKLIFFKIFRDTMGLLCDFFSFFWVWNPHS